MQVLVHQLPFWYAESLSELPLTFRWPLAYLPEGELEQTGIVFSVSASKYLQLIVIVP